MSTISATVVSAQKPLYQSLFVQVLAALLLGIVLGMAAPDFAVGLKILSDAFLKLISMIVAPIVFCVVVHGIAGAGDLKKVGRVGVKALIYFEVMTTVALIVGLLLAYLFGPGHGMNIDTVDARRQGARRPTPTTPTSCRAAASAASCSTSFRPPRSTRWRATTCCRCCSSRSCSASASRWSAAKRASNRFADRRGVDRAVPGHGADRAGGAARRARRGRLHGRQIRRRLAQAAGLAGRAVLRLGRDLRARGARRASWRWPGSTSSSSWPICARN